MYEQLPEAGNVKPVPTRFLPEGSLPEADDYSRGTLADDACKVHPSNKSIFVKTQKSSTELH